MTNVAKLKFFSRASIALGAVVLSAGIISFLWDRSLRRHIETTDPQEVREEYEEALEISSSWGSEQGDPRAWTNRFAAKTAVCWTFLMASILTVIFSVGFGAWVLWFHLAVGKTPVERKMLPSDSTLLLSVWGIALSVAGIVLQIASLEGVLW